MRKLKKRALTLIEILVVIILIMSLLGVLLYNFGGVLEKGNVTKTELGMERLQNVLEIALAENPNLRTDIESNWEQIVRSSPLVKNPNDLIYDGWGNRYQVYVENNVLIIRSPSLEEYRRKSP